MFGVMNHSNLFTCASCRGGIYLTISLDFFHGFGLLEFCQILCSTCWVMCCIISFLLCWILFHWSHTLCNGKRQLRPLFSMLSTTSQNTFTKFTYCVSLCCIPSKKLLTPIKKKNHWHLSNFLITSQCMRSGFLISLACITPDFTRQTSRFYLPHLSSTVVLIFNFYKGGGVGIWTLVLLISKTKQCGVGIWTLVLLISKTKQCH